LDDAALERSAAEDAALVRSAADETASRSRLLAEKAGPDYQRVALDRIRRSCASRDVVRLDEIVPASVASEAGSEKAAALFEISFDATAAGTPPRASNATVRASSLRATAACTRIRSMRQRAWFAGSPPARRCAAGLSPRMRTSRS